MKLRYLVLIIAIIMCFSSCKNGGTINDNQLNDENAQNNETKIVDLGVPSNGDTNLYLNARNPWDITVIDDALYIANGDFSNDSGPTSIWKYDNNISKWISSGIVEQEAIIRFANLNGKNIAIGADPTGRPGYAENYVLKEGKWKVFSKIEGALHTFDVEYFNDAFWFGVGYETDAYPVVKFIPETNEYVNIPLYKNGIDVVATLRDAGNIEYKRVYDLFNISGKLYCAFSVEYSGGKTTIEFFELKDNRFEFCQAFKASGMQMNKVVKNQMLFNSDAVLGGSCYLSLGNLYKTADFINFTKIDTPDNASVTDLLVENKNQTLYVLSVTTNDEGYKNTIYILNDDTWTEIYSFNHNCSALSFAKEDDCFYVGLGGDAISSNDIGEILKIAIN